MRDKWKDYRVMKRGKALRINLPETQLLTKKSFWEMMKKYNQVIIKPRNGSKGRGVTQISSLGKDLYEIHAENRKITLAGRQEVYLQLKVPKKSLRNKLYIVQQRIPLATIDNCPFDLRVMLQRKKRSSEWAVTGKLAKVAANNFIITNAAQNVLTVEEAIQNSNLPQIDRQMEDLLSEIDRIGLLATRQLHPKKKRTIGFDIGVDDKGKIWIIEANYYPVISMFKLLKDKTMYTAIRGYEKG